MSEYQYYEFRTIHRSLTEKERKEVSSLSSRTTATANSAVFVYNYSDFGHDEKEVLKKYFDAMLYVSNFSSKRLLFKYPSNLINETEMAKYCDKEALSLHKAGENVILDISLDDDEGGDDWIEGEGMLDGLLPLYSDILNGDYRALYIVWLFNAAKQADYDEKHLKKKEPPIPKNLNYLTPALLDFIDFVEIDDDLLTVAASISEELEETSQNFDYLPFIEKLSNKDKNDFLYRLLENENMLSAKFKRYLDEANKTVSVSTTSKQQIRTVGDILEQVEILKNKAKEQKRIAAGNARLKKLADLESKQTELWISVKRFIAEKNTKSYDQAINTLKDLLLLAKHKDTIQEFEKKVHDIMQSYSNLSSLIRKIKDAKLIKI